MARTLARTLGEYRAILGIKQREMERRCGIVKGLWSRYESGKGIPSEQNIEKICTYLRSQEKDVSKGEELVREVHSQWTRAHDYRRRLRVKRLSRSLRKTHRRRRRANGNPRVKAKAKAKAEVKRRQTTITSHGGDPLKRAALRIFNLWMGAETRGEHNTFRMALMALMEQAEGETTA
jgi:transcriptional regulator with XRE-family HTH domain